MQRSEFYSVPSANHTRSAADKRQGNHARDRVILVHGIRTRALWYDTIRPVLTQNNFDVALTNYGRFYLIRFLIPLRAVPKTQAMIWRWKRLAVVNSAASKVIRRDMAVLPS
jgi:hypothetical protein